MRLPLHLFAIPLSLIGFGMASAEESPSFVTPQPEHKLLDRFAGEWSFEKLSVPDDGAEPDTLGKGLVSAELVGGFFVALLITTRDGPHPRHGFQTLIQGQFSQPLFVGR